MLPQQFPRVSLMSDNSSTPQYRNKRLAVQLGTLIFIALIGAAGVFRVDLGTATFSIFGHQIWWSNFVFTTGLGLMLVAAPILTYKTIGIMWCGWACPQNAISEWANNLTQKMLGKRASVDIGATMQVAASKNKLANWVALGLIFLAASIVLSIIPFLFFYSLAETWGIVTHPVGANKSTLIFFAVIVFMMFVNIVVVRHAFCDYACFYRIGQRIFRTKKALHVSYDASRSADCAKCNYCATSCVTKIEPTNIEAYDSCINCGECIDACNRLHQKTGTQGLLYFKMGETKGAFALRNYARNMMSRSNLLVGALFLFGFSLAVAGVVGSVSRPHVQTKAERLAHQTAQFCQAQCISKRTACQSGNVAACYQAAACECQCQLTRDPNNPSANAWRQCVRNSTANAQAAQARASTEK
jgi:polyferredoxin